jgi:hypothetical protein
MCKILLFTLIRKHVVKAETKNDTLLNNCTGKGLIQIRARNSQEIETMKSSLL